MSTLFVTLHTENKISLKLANLPERRDIVISNMFPIFYLILNVLVTPITFMESM
jgi:hypothetical protein